MNARNFRRRTTTRDSVESPQSKRRRGRQERAVEAEKKSRPCALAEAKLLSDGTTFDLCGKVGSRIAKETNKTWQRFVHHYTIVQKSLLEEHGVDITPLRSDITIFCKNCYNQILTEARLHEFIRRLRDKIQIHQVARPQYCCVHGTSLDMCGSTERSMMRKDNDLAIAEQQCFLKTLYGVDVCGNKRTFILDELS